MANDPCSAGFFSKLFSGNAIVCSDSFRAAQTASGEAQIQSVADNAAENYNDLVATATQTAADKQAAQVSSDVNAIDDSVAASTLGRIFQADCDGSPGIDLSIVGGPCIKNSTLKEVALGLLLALIVGFFIYGAAILGPFIPKGRS